MGSTSQVAGTVSDGVTFATAAAVTVVQVESSDAVQLAHFAGVGGFDDNLATHRSSVCSDLSHEIT